MRRKFIIFLCSLVIVSGLSGCKGNDSSVPEPTAESSSQKEADYIPYKSLAGNYEIKLPSEWVQTTEGDNMTVTERNTGTYISVIREDYFPEVNNFSQDYLLQKFQNEGTTLQSYAKETGNHIKLVISYTTNNMPITEYKFIMWTYNSVYYINYIAPTKYAEQFMDTYKTVYQSFALVKDEPAITEGYNCMYNEDAQMSIEYPNNWDIKGNTSNFTITNPQTKSAITFEILDPIPNFKDYTQIEYNDIIQSFAEGAALNSFKNTGNTIYGSAYYVQDKQRFFIDNVLIDNTDYTVIVTFVASSSYAQMDAPTFEKMLGSIKYFENPEPQQPQESQQTEPVQTHPAQTQSSTEQTTTKKAETTAATTAKKQENKTITKPAGTTTAKSTTVKAATTKKKQ